jgi:asparagine synthase (glutamine-hydrolysing)
VSGFVGVRNREEPVTDELLARLWQPIAHRGPDGEERWRDGTLGVAAGVLRVTPESLGEEQPYHHRSGVVAVFDGRLDNREELLSALPSNDVSADDSDVALVAAAYATWGDRFPGRLNGEYAIAVFDPRPRTLLLARDVVGTRSLVFSTISTGDVVFGSEAKALLAHPSVGQAPNLDVLAEYVLGGSARATPWDSFFSQVRFVPPGVTVLIDDGGTTWRTHDAFDVERRSETASYSMMVDEYRHRFADAVVRRLRSAYPVGLLVSGGLDSSSILAVAARAAHGPPLIPVTFSFPAGSLADEEQHVQALERFLDLEIARVPMQAAGMVPTAQEQTATVEAPAVGLGWDSRKVALEIMADQGARAYLTGSWGDQVLVHQSYLVDLVDRLRWTDVVKHLRGYADSMRDLAPATFRRIFIDDLIRWHVPRSLSGLARRARTSLRGVHHDAPWYTAEFRARATSPATVPLIGGWSTVPVHPRNLQGRLRGFTSSRAIAWNGLAAASLGFDDRAPFLDRDLIAFVMSLPGESVSRNGRLRGIHVDAMTGVLPERIWDRRDKADGTAYWTAGIADEIPAIVQLFSGKTASGSMGIIDPDMIGAEVGSLEGRIRRGDVFREADLVNRVVALEAWLRAFPLDKR